MNNASQHVKDVTTSDFQQEVLLRSRDVPILVDFWAEWCEPCKTLSPLLERLTDEADGAFELAKVDVDANQELSTQFMVQSIPTIVAIKNGKEVDRFTGALPEASIRTFIEGILPTELDRMVDEARTALVAGDTAGAEHMFRQVLDMQSDHQEAGTSLAALLIDRGDIDDGLIVLGKLAPDSDVERLQAAARLRLSAGDDIPELEATALEHPDDMDAQMNLAKALAAHSEFEPALDRLLAVVARKGDGRDEARQAMVDIFEVLGNEHPLTATYRRQLATVLN
jgi:putative thioredoxin